MCILEGAMFNGGYFKCFIIPNSEKDFSGICRNVVSHLCSVIENKEWRRVIEIMDAFLSTSPKTEILPSISMTEAHSVWGDIYNFISNLQALTQ